MISCRYFGSAYTMVNIYSSIMLLTADEERNMYHVEKKQVIKSCNKGKELPLFSVKDICAILSVC